MVFAITLASVIIVSIISLVGIVAISIKPQKLKTVLIYMISFSAGALLGDVFVHLLPELINETGFTLQISLSVLAGIAIFFGIEKIIHWRHCHIPITKDHVHPLGIMNVIGDGVHNFLDGVIIGASYLVSVPVGVATTIAVIFHEIPQEISDMGVLLHSGMSRFRAICFNFLTALTAIAGAILALTLGKVSESLISWMIPLAAGGFIYIAASDLLPELHKGDINWIKSLGQLVFFILGVAVMVGLLYI